ncbi:MAG TPA: FkbM family methyltransferase [Candidatus Margulisiibacteriota bacterium]|nr:FkbM family methyltransferase [Candidatus Margulisiibacteriota bacterium]
MAATSHTQGLNTAFRFFRFALSHPSPLHNRIGAIGRFLLRQAHKRIVGRSLLINWEGLQLDVGVSSTSAAAAYYLGRPDWWEFDFLERFLRYGDTVVDVGANVGVYSLFMGKLVGPGGTVIACEPDPESAGALRANVVRNHLQHVEVVEAAVADKGGAVDFLSGLGTVSRIAADGGDHPSARVTLVTLDAVCRTCNPVFAKVDVEGFEDLVLRGANQLMQRGFPKVWQLEVDPHRTQQTASVAAELARFRYRCFVWNPGTHVLVPHTLGSSNANNVLAIADIGFVEQRLKKAAPLQAGQPGVLGTA